MGARGRDMCCVGYELDGGSGERQTFHFLKILAELTVLNTDNVISNGFFQQQKTSVLNLACIPESSH